MKYASRKCIVFIYRKGIRTTFKIIFPVNPDGSYGLRYYTIHSPDYSSTRNSWVKPLKDIKQGLNLSEVKRKRIDLDANV